MDAFAGLADVPVAEGSGGVSGLFLGTSSVLLRDGDTALLTDGFFTRPGWLRVGLGRIAPDRQVIDACLARAGVGSLAAVVCVHSHYDHAMDAPVIAERLGAPLVGSRSTANIGRGHGLPDALLRTVDDGESLRFGDFEVTFVVGVHCPGDLAPGTIDAPLASPARAKAYRTGEAYSVFFRHPLGTVLVQGSAGFVPGRLEGHRADIVYLGIGQLGRQTDEFRHRYWEETVTATGARTVIPIHWDDFTTPLLTRPLRPFPYFADDFGISMDFLVERSRRDDVRLVLPALWQDMTLFPA
jgi:L-ascorbate metabolism protein UlaG (beta-lactamase superfamily)